MGAEQFGGVFALHIWVEMGRVLADALVEDDERLHAVLSKQYMFAVIDARVVFAQKTLSSRLT